MDQYEIFLTREDVEKAINEARVLWFSLGGATAIGLFLIIGLFL